jgi:hypothetical protein
MKQCYQTKPFHLRAVTSIIILLFIFGIHPATFAGLGMHGAKTVTTANVILNEFTTLNADVSAGSVSITVGNSALNANSRFTGNLSAGELVMIIQMQGASMNTASTVSSTWGAITSYNNAGKYEFNEVAGVPNSTTISFIYPLTNSYTQSGKVQVIRVPRYTNFIVTGSGSITTQAWNGSTGGVLAVEANGNTMISGSVNVTGLGFRGGAADNGSGNANSVITLFASTDSLNGGEKGEGIGGSKTTYDLLGGRYGRGAPASGGGGGNSHNAGGGGGANAGNPALWNGWGNPDTSVSSWKSAWDLEGGNFHANVSTGGGRGGYSYAMKNRDPLTVAPGSNMWNGNNRSNTGGYGGRPFDYLSNRIFMGGGGGAGDINNNEGTPGSNGGGIVYLISGGLVSGNGTINANGIDAPASNSPTNGDGEGGAGAGGAVFIYTSGATIQNITFNAKGGKGSDQNDYGTAESEGPGGGGGGGCIYTTNATSLTRNVNGGMNGITNSSSMVAFLPNGATMGHPGIILLGPPNPYSGFTPLPISLKNFSGEIKNKIIELAWITESEINNDYFTLERSPDGFHYVEIGREQGAGTSTMEHIYTWLDESPANGDNYYKLSQVDFDGQREEFAPVHLRFKMNGKGFYILDYSPTVFDDHLAVYYNDEKSEQIEIQIFNPAGELIKSRKVISAKGFNSFTFEDVETLKKGIYFIRLLTEDRVPAIMKAMKY